MEKSAPGLPESNLTDIESEVPNVIEQQDYSPRSLPLFRIVILLLPLRSLDAGEDLAHELARVPADQTREDEIMM